MSIKRLVLSSLLAVSFCTPSLVSGQNTGKGPKEKPRHESRWSVLPAAEREKMKAAHEKAMNDPSVQRAKQNLREARHEFRETVNAAMIKADPSVQQILQKLKAEKRSPKEEE